MAIKKCLLTAIILAALANSLHAQEVYTIKADSVKLTNCDSTELIIENHTQGVKGFLFNTGNGRTLFRKGLIQLNDSLFLIGGDTFHTAAYSYWKANGNNIYNTNSGRVGIHRNSPNVLLDLPGPVNIDDTSAYRIGYHPIIKASFNATTYRNIFVGDSAGTNAGDGYNFTYVGAEAGKNSQGTGGTFLGYAAGRDNHGASNTFLGLNSGQNNGTAGNYASNNTFVGALSGPFSTGHENSFLGANVGYSSTGDSNTYIGYYVGGFANGNNNIYMGFNSGHNSSGSNNIMVGVEAGKTHAGYNNVYVGNHTGLGDTVQSRGTINKVTLIGDSADVVAHYTLSNSTAIGHKAVVKNSNAMVFGDTAVNTWLFNSNATATAGEALIVGSNSGNGNGAYLSTGGVWTNASDMFKKENFEVLDKIAVLDKIDELPVTRWNYKGLSETHIGPMAQDFFRVFQVGVNDKTISTIDPAGIALAGIQGLYMQWKKTEMRADEQQVTLNEQQIQIAELKAMLREQKAQMTRMLEKIEQFETIQNGKKRRTGSTSK